MTGAGQAVSKKTYPQGYWHKASIPYCVGLSTMEPEDIHDVVAVVFQREEGGERRKRVR